MTHYTQLFLQVLFVGLIIGTVAVLVFALLCEAFGWYDSTGRYNGPFSKPKEE